MKYLLTVPFLALAVSSPALASVVHTYDGALPSSPMDLMGPTPTSASGAILFTPPVGTGVPAATYVGLTTSYPGVARSPFETSPPGTYNAPPGYYGVSSYTSISGHGSACFGTCTAVGSAGTGFGSGGDTLSFVYGSPDRYNELQIFLDSGTILTYFGSSIAPTPSTGYVTEHFSGLGSYHGVQFSSTSNSFEFSVSSVPLPASLPMFGSALVALAGYGYRVKRKATRQAA